MINISKLPLHDRDQIPHKEAVVILKEFLRLNEEIK
jgi:hypothetical protein